MTTSPTPPTTTRSLSGILLLAGSLTFIAPWAALALAAERGQAWRSGVAGLGLVVLALAGAYLSTDELVLGRSLLVIGVGCLAIALEYRPSNPRPSLLVLLPTAQFMSTAAHLLLMDLYPTRFSRLWEICRALPTLETVQWMLLVGLVSYEAGRLLLRGAGPIADRFASTARAWLDDLGSQSVTLDVISGLGVAIFLLTISIRGVGYLTSRTLPVPLQGILGSLDFLYYLGLYAAVAAALGRGWRRPWVAAWVLASLAYEVLSGSKGRFALYVLFPLGLLVLARERRPGFALAGGALATFFVSWLVVYPILAEYRGELVRAGYDTDARLELLDNARARAADTYQETILVPLFDSMLTEHVTAMASIVHFDVRRPAEDLPVRLFLFWIPRAVWPEKPQTLNANEIGRASHRVSPADETTSVVTTGVGELYIHLGPWGALMFLLNGFVVALTVSFLRLEGSPSDLELGAAVMVSRVLPGFVGGTYDMAFTGYLIQFISVTAILLFLRWTTRTRSPTVAPAARNAT